MKRAKRLSRKLRTRDETDNRKVAVRVVRRLEASGDGEPQLAGGASGQGKLARNASEGAGKYGAQQDPRWGREPKKRITLFLDADVLAWFREGPKYQTRINQALREIVRREKEEAGE